MTPRPVEMDYRQENSILNTKIKSQTVFKKDALLKFLKNLKFTLFYSPIKKNGSVGQ